MRPLVLQQVLKLGEPSFIYIEEHAEDLLAADRVTMNAPSPNFVLVGTILINGLDCFVGEVSDAFTFNKNMAMKVDFPPMRPKTGRAKVIGWYTGFVPEAFCAGDEFLFEVALWRSE